ncbi:hypothetical protein [Vibrio phage 33Fb.4]|nr:hypothetical protein [Vibrio phage 31Fb.4]WAG58455.1 hypothetical protein [Vibrio phage 33Fb.4]
MYILYIMLFVISVFISLSFLLIHLSFLPIFSIY